MFTVTSCSNIARPGLINDGQTLNTIGLASLTDDTGMISDLEVAWAGVFQVVLHHIGGLDRLGMPKF